MMTKTSTADRPERRTAEPRSWPRPPGLALFGLALFGLIQAGCQSDGCSKCGIGNSISNGVQALGNGVKSVGSIFHHKKSCGGAADCGCGGEGGSVVTEGVVMDQGMSMPPGAMSMPVQGTIVPPPVSDSENLNLKALPDSPPNPTSGTSKSGGGVTSKSTTSRSTPPPSSAGAYSTSVPRYNPTARRGPDADQSLAKSSGRPTEASGASDLFDKLPPLDLPTDVTRKAAGSPASTNPSPTPDPSSTPTPASAVPAEKVSAADGGTLLLPPINAVASHQAPGLRRYASIAPSVAGGSAPSLEGLDWLKEKGYRTLLDLRKSAEVDPNFVDAVNDRGMVYISLPIMANRLDASRLARFSDLISRTENRPVFFCDTDGSRAALAWYIHERTIGGEDAQGAQSKSEELGLNPADVKLGEEYLSTHKPKAKSAMAKVALASPGSGLEGGSNRTSTPPSEMSPPALPEAPDLPGRGATPPAVPPRLDEPSPAMLPGEDRPQASNGSKTIYRDPAAWKPVAALVLTGIGVPLAFWSRTMLSEYRHVRRQASLPGAKRRSLDAPAGSDA